MWLSDSCNLSWSGVAGGHLELLGRDFYPGLQLLLPHVHFLTFRGAGLGHISSSDVGAGSRNTTSPSGTKTLQRRLPPASLFLFSPGNCESPVSQNTELQGGGSLGTWAHSLRRIRREHLPTMKKKCGCEIKVDTPKPGRFRACLLCKVALPMLV